MPTRVDLTGQVGNDETLKLTVTNTAGGPYDLTDKEFHFYLKRYSSQDDADALIHFTETSPEVDLVDGPAGRLDVAVNMPPPHWRYWWRLDVIEAGRRITALYGYLEMEPV